MRESFAVRCFILFVASVHIALPVNLLGYVSHSAGSGVGRNDCRTVPSPSGERVRVRESFAVRCFILFVASAHIALPVNLLRYVSHSAGSVQGAASRRRPLYPPGSGQQHRHGVVPSTYPCRLRVGPRQRPCKTRPSARIPAGCPGPSGNVLAMLRPPAPAVSAAPCPAAIHILGLDPVGRVSVAPPGKITAQQGCLEGNQCLPGGATLARAYRICAYRRHL